MNALPLLIVLLVGGLALLVGRLVGRWIDRQEVSHRDEPPEGEA